MNVLVTRPAHQGRATAARLEALGHQTLLAPLLRIVPQAWEVPAGPFDAVMLTSANAVQGLPPVALRQLPAYCVGERCAAAARSAGYSDVRTGAAGGAAALLPLVAQDGHGRVLHLAGADVRQVSVPPTLSIERVTVYAAETAPLTDSAATALAAGRTDRTLIYSGRTLAQFAAECDRLGLSRGTLSVGVLGDADAADLEGWKSLFRPAYPGEEALFAAAGLLCEKRSCNR